MKLTGVSRVPGSSPPAISVLGDDFSSVDEVIVNDITAPSYYVTSRNEMFVTLPEAVSADALLDVAVVSRSLVLSRESLMKFRVSRVPSKVNGLLRLLQVFIKVLLTTPGSDIFNPRLGGGALKNIGRTFSKNQTGSIVSDFVVAVDNTTRQITAIQSRQPQLPADERLLSAKITSANFSITESGLLVTVEVTSHTGRAALANVVA